MRHVGTTHHVDCKSGKVIETVTGSDQKIRVPSKLSAGHIVIGNLDAAVGNPVVPASPDIDFVLEFAINLALNEVVIKGKVDAFPAFEAYIKCPSGTIKQLFRVDPTPGADPLNLFGAANRPVRGDVKC